MNSTSTLPLRTTNKTAAVASCLIVVAVMLLSHPYAGVRHDGILYAGEALSRLTIGDFQKDLYFHYGSQGRFTVMPLFYAALIKAFSLGAGSMIGLLIAFGLYLAAAIYLIRCIAPERLRFYCLLAVVLGWTYYGGFRMFAYSETFLTARSYCEPAVLFGLGALVRGRRLVAVLALLAAIVIHPLIGFAGALVAWVFVCRQQPKWLLLGVVGAVGVVVLALVGKQPFDDLFLAYDPKWLELLEDVNGQAFLTRWSSLDFGVLVFSLACLWLAARHAGHGPLRELVVAVAIAGVGATLVSFVAVDILHNPFFGKLQIWRALWIVQWLAVASLPLTVVALWKRDESGRVVALFLILGWMAPFTMAPAVLALIAVAIDAFAERITITRTTTWLVGAATVGAALTIVVQYEARLFKGGIASAPLGEVLGQVLAINILLFALAWLIHRYMRRPGFGGVLVALVAVAGASLLWDQRTAWAKRLESYPVGHELWPGLVEPDAKVYWYRDLMAPWVLLGHANYYTGQQASGAVFSRDLVVELAKRRQVTAVLDFQEQICRMMNGLNEKPGSCEPDTAAASTVCDDAKIDYIVLQSTLQSGRPLASFATGVIENGYEKRFFLYRCSSLKTG